MRFPSIHAVAHDLVSLHRQSVHLNDSYSTDRKAALEVYLDGSWRIVVSYATSRDAYLVSRTPRPLMVGIVHIAPADRSYSMQDALADARRLVAECRSDYQNLPSHYKWAGTAKSRKR